LSRRPNFVKQAVSWREIREQTGRSGLWAHPDDQGLTKERFEKAIRDRADFELDYR
jgi:hypothetical protein